ncbi:flotillin family protein [Thermogemmatispora tikiterensis]|uniref:Flotillin n=1 Tax=Thermogemmatispora tikiterensis TaxID=1825093 RepID=A0A328VCC1_9CHLR|nr:flotillin family protein [Thermogemmatispora tikiterensis]RAQ95378.1 flotillin [Thermogemmatispora tikiterensis]
MFEGVLGPVVGGVLLLVVLVIIAIALWASMLRKVGPNRALIIYGAGGTDVVTGGAKFVFPLISRAQEFPLELMSFDVAPAQDLYTSQGVAVNVEAVTQIKVRSDKESIKTAAEQFLSKSQQERENLIRLVMEGHLRGIVGQLTVEDLVKDPESVSAKMLKTVSADMEKMGLEVISFTIKDVRDKNDYIANMGRPQIAEIRKQADIAAALAARDTQIQQAQAAREAAIARSLADQERAKAEAESQAKQAEYQRDLLLKKAAFDAEVKKQQAAADKAYDIQANIMQQQVVEEAIKVTEVEKHAQIRVQEAEIQRRELELQATVQKAAEAERRRIETVAEAERQRLILEAQGQADAARMRGMGEAEAARARGMAEAEVIRAKGLAEAEVIRAKGEAEAEAMKVKAAAYHEYNQAAVLDKLLTNMPEIVRAIAEPLSKVDKVTIVSTGNSANGVGASRLTGDIMNMAAQIPALFELLSGVHINELMARVPTLKGQTDQQVASSDERASEAEAGVDRSGVSNHQA